MENPRDFIDVMLIEILQTSDVTSSFYGQKGRDALFNVVIDLFLAGQETTASTLVWIFFYMLHHPDVQDSVHQEIDQVHHTVPNLHFLSKKSILEKRKTTSILTDVQYRGFVNFEARTPIFGV